MKTYLHTHIRVFPAAIVLLFFFIRNTACGQDKKVFKPSHELGINIGHEYSFSGISENGGKNLIVLPYWGLDYNFRFAEKFSLGLHTDFIVESFKVETDAGENEEEVTERTRPIAPALMGFYKPTEHWNLGLGMGGEFAKEGNYWLNRIAVEYSVGIKNGWEVFGVFQYDLRWSAYDTWTLGLGISKSFGKR